MEQMLGYNISININITLQIHNLHEPETAESMPPSNALSSQFSCPHLDSTALDPHLSAILRQNPQIMAK